MKEIKIGDLLIDKNRDNPEIFKVTSNLTWDGKRLYSCDTWIEGKGFVDNGDYDMFTDQHIEDFGFEIYSPK